MIYRPAPVAPTRRNALKKAIMVRAVSEKYKSTDLNTHQILNMGKQNAMKKRLAYLESILARQKSNE